MELQSCECHVCEQLHKKLPPLVFNNLDTESPVSSTNLTIGDTPNIALVSEELTSSDITNDATIPTLVIDEPTSSDITDDATIPTQVIDDPTSSDITDDATIPTLVIDEATSPAVTQLTPRRSERARKPLQKLNL